jgi:hypothetical protein
VAAAPPAELEQVLGPSKGRMVAEYLTSNKN